jgi:hypothetical protein
MRAQAGRGVSWFAGLLCSLGSTERATAQGPYCYEVCLINLELGGGYCNGTLQPNGESGCVVSCLEHCNCGAGSPWFRDGAHHGTGCNCQNHVECPIADRIFPTPENNTAAEPESAPEPELEPALPPPSPSPSTKDAASVEAKPAEYSSTQLVATIAAVAVVVAVVLWMCTRRGPKGLQHKTSQMTNTNAL